MNVIIAEAYLPLDCPNCGRARLLVRYDPDAARKRMADADSWRVAQEESRLPWTDPNLVYRAMNVIEAARGGNRDALASALTVWDELSAFYGHSADSKEAKP